MPIRNLRNPVRAYVALGANLGDPAAMLKSAALALAEIPLTTLVQLSGFYKTAPLNTDDSGIETAAPGGDYCNAVAALDTSLPAPVLLQALQAIEQRVGRVRSIRNAPRLLDLDLLLYGAGCVASSNLTVPHPRMAQRAFVLRPLAEIAPGEVSATQLQAVAHQAIGPWVPATQTA